MTNFDKQRAVDECNDAIASITAYDGLTIELRGVWVWVSGETQRHHVALKGAGFKFAPKKKMWFWHPDWIEVAKGKVASMEWIRNTYEGRVVETGEGIA